MIDPTAFIKEISAKLSRGEIKQMIHILGEGRLQFLVEFPTVSAGLDAKDCLETLAAMLASDRRDGEAPGSNQGGS